MTFLLDERLAQDSSFVADLPLCQVRLHHNAAFPWIILVPRINNIVEIIDLSDGQQLMLWQEVVQATKVMKKIFTPQKLNVAALGNVVSQLHVHVIARYSTDSAWPATVWSSDASKQYNTHDMQNLINSIAKEL